MLILAPTIIAELKYPTLQIRSHLDIHGAYIYQLLLGSTPVESAFLAGVPANYYWMYHAYFASIVGLTSLSPPFVITFASLLALLVSLSSIGRTVLALGLAKEQSMLLGFTILAVFFSVNITAILSVFAHHVNGTFVEHVRVMILPGGNRHLHSTLLAATGLSSMYLGFALFCTAIWTCISVLADRLDLMKLTVLSSCFIAALAVQQVAALVILATSVGGLALTALIQLRGIENKFDRILQIWNTTRRTIGLAQLKLWFAASAFGVMALVKYSLDIARIASSDFPFGFVSLLNLKMIVASLLLFLPFYFLQFALLRRQSELKAIFVQAAGSVLLFLALILGLPDTNQYKAVFFLSIPISLSALLSLQRLQNNDNIGCRTLGWIFTTLVVTLMLLQTAFINHYNLYLVENHVDRGFQYYGVHLNYPDEPYNRISAYNWIRANTPTDAVIIQPLYCYRYANVLMERSVYIKRTQSSTLWQHQNYVNGDVFIYPERKNDLGEFFRTDLTIGEYRDLLAKIESHITGRALFAVVKDEELNPELMAVRGAELVYEHESDGAHVYWLNP